MRRVTRAAAPALTLMAAVAACGHPSEEPWDVTTDVGALAPAPLDLREEHSLVWSGSEVLVWGGHGAGGQHDSFDDGAAYDPASDSWRELAASGLESRTRHSALMVGDRMLVWGGFTPTHSGGADAHVAADGAFYDPDDDTWEPIARAPEGRTLARGVVADGHVVFGGGSGEQGQEEFLVYTPGQDDWHTVPIGDGTGNFTVLDLAARGGTVVAAGVSSGELGAVVFRVGDTATGIRDLSHVAEYDGGNVSAGLAASTAGDLFLAARSGETASLFELDGEGRAELVEEREYTDFRPPVSAATHPLLAGGMDAVDGLALVATAPGEFSLWDPESGRTYRQQTEGLGDYCGPLVPVADDALLGWGGLCASTGVRVDLDT
ncbi:hypothetical protein [Nocardiopsis sp. YSL2]|uniref:Kelch repeat-containing protein n=1 Tax=Nocardiopsis sp. YSL2 TaxID=2939492 RepID=UPI0026F4169C|nr:hypothetical protein [Nocardiopsis sp. YSL2]